MPYMKVNYRSDWVGRKDLSVFYPKKAPSAGLNHATLSRTAPPPPLPEGGKYQVLYLMHGGGGDFADWPLNAMIMRVCEAAQLVVVMPTIQDFVSEQIELGDFYACVSKELPEFMCNILPVSPAREDNFIAGLSYGGYFAYRIAMNNPERYACVGSFASPLDVASDIRDKHMGQNGYPLPEEIKRTEKDVLYMARKQKEAGTIMPKLFQTCGTEDFTWEYNVTARDLFRELEYDHTWIEGPGSHNFDFFDASLKKFLKWLPLANGPVFPSPDIVLPRGGRFYED